MVTREELLDLALLSKLDISDSDIDKLLGDMEEIIKFADTINAASTGDAEFDNINDLQNVYREDIVKDSFLQDDILRNCKTVENGFFRVDNHNHVE